MVNKRLTPPVPTRRVGDIPGRMARDVRRTSMSTNSLEHQKGDLVWEVGETSTGSETHLIDFDTDSLLAIGRGEPDQALCGRVGDYHRTSDQDVTCQMCRARMADVPGLKEA